MKKILMIILDGFGIREEEHGNAIKTANMPFFNKVWEEYPHSLLQASGEYVGLPENQFGNSEVCHGVIGLGRKITQKITVVGTSVKSKSIYENENLKQMVKHLKDNDSTLHLMGLLSDGGVHSHIDYMLDLIPVLKEMGVKKLYFHAITDGRDTAVNVSKTHLDRLQKTFKENKLGLLASICGRYYAMDRDKKYDRTKYYYYMVVGSGGLKVLNLDKAIEHCYSKEVTDEFLPPLLLEDDVKIKDSDCLLWLNFRQDRSRQILNAINDPSFNAFKTRSLNNFKLFTLFEEESIPNATSLFKFTEEELYPIGEYFSDLGLTQARISETEKYSHVTKFFNSEKSDKFRGTDNFLIPSPKVPTYDQMPLMSAPQVTDQAIKCLEKDYDFILMNYPNPDMVGHTGNFDKTVEALEGLDKELERLITNAEDNFYKVIILADHGNADYMLDENNNPVTTHSSSPVPFILMDKSIKLKSKGDLTNVAPTLLEYVDIALPEAMKESKSLIINDN